MTNIIEGLRDDDDRRREAALGFARALVEVVGETDPERVARLAVEMADAVLRHLQQASK